MRGAVQPFLGDPGFRKNMRSLLESEGQFPERSKLLESLDYFDSMVDPYDAFRGENGELWDMIAGANYGASEPFLGLLGFRNEMELRMARNLSRIICKENPWAINALENRVNYVVARSTLIKSPRRTAKKFRRRSSARSRRCLISGASTMPGGENKRTASVVRTWTENHFADST